LLFIKKNETHSNETFQWRMAHQSVNKKHVPLQYLQKHTLPSMKVVSLLFETGDFLLHIYICMYRQKNSWITNFKSFLCSVSSFYRQKPRFDIERIFFCCVSLRRNHNWISDKWMNESMKVKHLIPSSKCKWHKNNWSMVLNIGKLKKKTKGKWSHVILIDEYLKWTEKLSIKETIHNARARTHTHSHTVISQISPAGFLSFWPRQSS